MRILFVCLAGTYLPLPNQLDSRSRDTLPGFARPRCLSLQRVSQGPPRIDSSGRPTGDFQAVSGWFSLFEPMRREGQRRRPLSKRSCDARSHSVCNRETWATSRRTTILSHIPGIDLAVWRFVKSFDEAGHLIGEYSSTGALIQETVWLGDIPVATLRPSGSTIAIYYVHTDLLNTPHLVTRPSDNKQRWRWFRPTFGNSLPNTNPGGAGTFNYNLRYPGQIYDGQAGRHQNYFRDYDSAVGR